MKRLMLAYAVATAFALHLGAVMLLLGASCALCAGAGEVLYNGIRLPEE